MRNPFYLERARLRIAVLALAIAACKSSASQLSGDGGAAIDASGADDAVSVDTSGPVDAAGTADAAAVDAGPIIGDGGTLSAKCDPVAQTGCAANQKCTWIVDIDATNSTDEVGHVDCAPTGTTTDAAACADAAAAINGGADSCVAGDLCIGGKCKPICDPLATSGMPGACAVKLSCSEYVGVFTPAGMPDKPTAGVCEPDCDPLTQQLLVGTGPIDACGSVDPTMPSATCVPRAGFSAFHCAPSAAIVYSRTDRVPPLADGNGVPFANGCAPGFIPFFFTDATSAMVKVCSGMCAPADVDASIAAIKGNETLNAGVATALGKLVADAVPVAGHATCAVHIKGSDAREDCRYIWPTLAGSRDPTKATDSPYNDTLGMCFAFADYVTVDTSMPPDGTPDAAEKSCAELQATAAPGDPFGSAASNGCYSLAKTKALGATAAAATRWRTSSFRLGYPAGTVVRHVFD